MTEAQLFEYNTKLNSRYGISYSSANMNDDVDSQGDDDIFDLNLLDAKEKKKMKKKQRKRDKKIKMQMAQHGLLPE